VLRAVRFLAKSIMDQAGKRRNAQAFKRGGVGLTDLVCADARQADLFFGPDEKAERAMAVLDKINAKWGRGTMGVGTVGWRVGGVSPQESRRGTKEVLWRPTLRALSPANTTKWSDLLRVR